MNIIEAQDALKNHVRVYRPMQAFSHNELYIDSITSSVSYTIKGHGPITHFANLSDGTQVRVSELEIYKAYTISNIGITDLKEKEEILKRLSSESLKKLNEKYKTYYKEAIKRLQQETSPQSNNKEMPTPHPITLNGKIQITIDLL